MKWNRKTNALSHLKYAPIVASFGWVLFLVARLFGWYMPVIELMEIAIGFYVVWAFSNLLNFCLVHKVMIHYSFAVTMFYLFHREIGLGSVHKECVCVLLVVGVALFVWLIFRRFGKKCVGCKSCKKAEMIDKLLEE